MGTNEIKVPKDWKFLAQIVVLIGGITGGLTANNTLNDRVQRLEERAFKAETMYQIQIEQTKELKEAVKELRDELKARKIVGRVAASSNFAGEAHVSE